MRNVDATLELHVKREGSIYKIHAKSVFGEREGLFKLPSLNSRIHEILDCIEEQGKLDREFVTIFGTQLFTILFSDVKELFHTCLDQSDHLNIILYMEDPLLNEIPWELCYDPDNQLFLGASPRCSLVRRDHKSLQTFRAIDYPLKILVIISSPMDLERRDEYQPDPDEIESLMEPVKKLVEKGMVELDFLERASVKHIQDALKKGYHIVHFIGHGFYNKKDETGYLIIEDKNRDVKELEGRGVAQLFGTNPPRLMVLTACESSPLIPFLLSRKVPAALAMQYTVLKDIAHEFVDRFYSMLVTGDSVAQAVSEARSAVLLQYLRKYI